MTIDDLREMIEGLPGDAEVLVEFEDSGDFRGDHCVYLEAECNEFKPLRAVHPDKPFLFIRTSPPDEVARFKESPAMKKLLGAVL